MLTSIQVLRAVAALGVVFGHLWAEFAVCGDRSFPNFIVGAAGVDLFFVVSGFVIVYSSESFFARDGGATTFLLRRIARIVPLYWAATTLFLLYLVWQFRTMPVAEMLSLNDLSWPVIAASYVFLPFPRASGATAPALSLGWTLSYEMFFYVIFACAILLPRRIAVLVASTTLLALPYIVPYLGLSPPNPLPVLCNTMLYEFVYGMAIAFALREGLRLPLWLAAAMVAIGIGMIAWTGMDASGITIVPRQIIWGGGAALIVAGATLAQARALPDGRVTKALCLLGDASFSLYLLHTLVFCTVRMYVPKHLSPVAHPWVYATLLVCSAIGVAIAVYLHFERPLTKMLQRRIAMMLVTSRPQPATA